MKKLLALILIGFLGIGINAQEIVRPLQGNPSLQKEQATRAPGNALDSTFVFQQSGANLTLPIWDDFSINRFEQYNPKYGDANVTSQWYYYIMNSSNTLPMDPTIQWCDSSHNYHDTVSITVGVTTVSTTYPPTETEVIVNDLNNWPIVGETMDLYQECYALIDTVIDGVPDPTQDTIWFTGLPDFVQDSAHVFTADLNNPNTIWLDNKAYHNYRFAVDPWSIGFATFDGVDTNGVPYNFGNPSAHGIADILTSKPVNLAGKSNVFLTFLYQAGGHGDNPEGNDTLIVEFYDPIMQTWTPAWKSFPGDIPIDVWDTAHIAVPIALLVNNFQFRFMNYANTSGALDHWHIDYVQLDENPLLVVQEFKDLAISYPINTLLKDYTSVPWDHYLNATPSEKMLDSANLYVYNSDPVDMNFANGELVAYYQGAVQGGTPYALPNPANSATWTGNWQPGLNNYRYPIGANFTYDPLVHDSLARFNIKLNIAANVTGSNSHTENDTTYYEQVFANYYAYDDGSAEVAYGLQGSHSMLAYQFNAYEEDTLMGVLISFVPSVEDLGNKIFLLTIWDDDNGQPGDIIYQDDYFNPHYPVYANYINGFVFYTFAEGQRVPVGETFYVGMEQVDSESLNLGMDMNIDNSDKIFYNVTGNWATSSYPASLLMRPLYSTKINNTLGIEEEQKEVEQVYDIQMYPNPTQQVVNFNGLPSQYTIDIYDLSGRLVTSVQNDRIIDVSFLNTGIYVVNILDEEGVSIYTSKLIKE